MASSSPALKGLVDYDVSNSSDSECHSDSDVMMDMENKGVFDVNNDRMEQTGADGPEKSEDLSVPMEVAPRSVPPSDIHNGPPSSKKSKAHNDASKFRLPNTIQSMFGSSQQRWVDEPSEHDSRVRSFPHVEGNWATHVYIPVPWDNRMFELVNACVQLLHPLPFHTMPELHASLSRTVTIRHHWIEALVDSLRANLRHVKSCISDFSTVRLFTNDEKTRTFLCFELSLEDTHFTEYVEAVDKSLLEFKLPTYYENPSFHVSVGWCLGDVTGDVTEEKLTQLKEMLASFLAQHPDLSVLDVHQVCCRTGNKSFFIPLDQSHR